MLASNPCLPSPTWITTLFWVSSFLYRIFPWTFTCLTNAVFQEATDVIRNLLRAQSYLIFHCCCSDANGICAASCSGEQFQRPPQDIGKFVSLPQGCILLLYRCQKIGQDWAQSLFKNQETACLSFFGIYLSLFHCSLADHCHSSYLLEGKSDCRTTWNLQNLCTG